jgi:hypothetical protein
MRAPDALPAAIIAATEYLTSTPLFDEADRPIIERLRNLSAIWHRLGRTSPVIARPRLLNMWAARYSIPEKERAGAERWTDKELALQLAFYWAFQWASMEDNRMISKPELRAEVGSYREQAERLRKEAEDLRKRLGEPVLNPRGILEGAMEHAQALERAAKWCETQSNIDMLSRTPLLVHHHQGDPRARAFVVYFVRTLRELYGKEFRGSLAKITNTVLRPYYPVTDHDVRFWAKE